MKLVIKTSIMLISVVLVFQLCSTVSHAEEPEFIITLKNGAEIATKQYEIEDGIVYYRFSGSKRIVGVDQRNVVKITEHLLAMDLAEFELPKRTLAKTESAKEPDVYKALAKYDYTVDKEAAKETHHPAYSIEEARKYLDVENQEYVLVVEGSVRKNNHYASKPDYPIMIQYKNSKGKIVLQRELFPAEGLKNVEPQSYMNFTESIPITRKARACSIVKDDTRYKRTRR